MSLCSFGRLSVDHRVFLAENTSLSVTPVPLSPGNSVAASGSHIHAYMMLDFLRGYTRFRYSPNQIIKLAAAQIAKRKGKPFQLSPVSSMIA